MRGIALSPRRFLKWLKLANVMPYKDAAKLAFLRFYEDEILECKIKAWDRTVAIRPATSDIYVFQDVMVRHEYVPPKNLYPKTILDAGAYVGLSTLYFHFLYPEAQIIALEPDPKTFELLKRNICDIPQITAINAALWNTETKLQFVSDVSAPWASRIAQQCDKSDCQVQCVTLSQVVQLVGGHFDMMKFDIEGAEASVFEGGGEEFFAQVKAIVIEFHERLWPGSSLPFLNAVRPFSHTTVNHGEYTWFLFDTD